MIRRKTRTRRNVRRRRRTNTKKEAKGKEATQKNSKANRDQSTRIMEETSQNTLGNHPQEPQNQSQKLGNQSQKPENPPPTPENRSQSPRTSPGRLRDAQPSWAYCPFWIPGRGKWSQNGRHWDPLDAENGITNQEMEEKKGDRKSIPKSFEK